MIFPNRRIIAALNSLLFFTLGLALHGGEKNATNRFGFTGPEIFPIDPGIGEIHAADINGDGLMDLLVVNNSRSKINILYNQTGKTNLSLKSIPAIRAEQNELPPDSRFRIDSIASEKRISSFVVADLNGDGRPDIAYYGEPKELVIQYNLGPNGWSAPKKVAIDDGQLSQNALVAGDLNGDGRTDLILLSENYVYFLSQSADHQLAEPEKIPFTGSIKAVQILDIDGDGRNDLVLVNWDNAFPFRFRLQNAAGQLGPENHLAMPPVRSYWADDLDGDHKTEIITIASQSGRAQISNFTQRESEKLAGSFYEGQFQVLALNKTAKTKRGVLWADLNKDQRADLIVAEPDSGQLTIFFQKQDGSLDSPKTFPSFTGVSDLAVADWDGDGNPDLFLLSSDERQVGVTHLDANGRLPFPQILPMDGRPLAMCVGNLAPTGKPAKIALAVITEVDGRKELRVRTSDGTVTSQKLNENFKSNPASMAIHDANQDGLPDIVILIPYEKIKVLVQVADKPFEEADVAAPGGTVEQPWLSLADVDGDGKLEMLLAQKNFLRAVVLKSDPATGNSTNKNNWSFQVREQINGVSSSSRIIGAAPLKNGTNTQTSLFLLDAERKVLTLCERDKAGVWQVVKNTALPVSDFNSIQAVTLGGTAPNSVAFIGGNSVAWMSLAGKVWQVTELDGYETPIKGGFLNDVVSGDLNNDGRKDLVFLETAKNYLDIVTFEPPHQIVPANRWQVFEERTFRNRRSDMPEPREALIADVTGDGKNDLIVIVHDRILVYPQE